MGSGYGLFKGAIELLYVIAWKGLLIHDLYLTLDKEPLIYKYQLFKLLIDVYTSIILTRWEAIQVSIDKLNCYWFWQVQNGTADPSWPTDYKYQRELCTAISAI